MKVKCFVWKVSVYQDEDGYDNGYEQIVDASDSDNVLLQPWTTYLNEFDIEPGNHGFIHRIACYEDGSYRDVAVGDWLMDKYRRVKITLSTND